jgi:3'-5' exonuclease
VRRHAPLPNSGVYESITMNQSVSTRIPVNPVAELRKSISTQIETTSRHDVCARALKALAKPGHSPFRCAQVMHPDPSDPQREEARKTHLTAVANFLYMNRIAASFLLASTCDNGQFRFQFETVVLEGNDETAFLRACARLLPPGRTAVTYNGRGFDAQVLRLRCMATGQFDAAGLVQHAHADRFGRAHCDLADQMSSYGATRKVGLAEICKPLGIPAKTTVHGSDVGALWQNGEVEKNRDYVEEDVAATYLLWLHWVSFRHCRESMFALPLASFSQWIEQSPAHDHLLPFATCPPSIRARNLAPGHRLTRAAKFAGTAVQQDADEAEFSGPLLFD